MYNKDKWIPLFNLCHVNFEQIAERFFHFDRSDFLSARSHLTLIENERVRPLIL